MLSEVYKKEFESFMREALAEAEKAFAADEVPVGAVVVYEGDIIARAHNMCETLGDPTAHAEILVLSAAAEVLGEGRLTEADLYVTLEPCPMCAGAIRLHRIRRLIFGADDVNLGAVGSCWDIVRSPVVPSNIEVIGGILKTEAAELLQEFFRQKR